MSQILKRDGSAAAWQPSRVLRAVSLAFYAHQSGDQENPSRNDQGARYGLDPETARTAEQIAARVVETIEPRFERGDVPSVEQVGDLTERAIAEAGYWDVARRYLVYRSKHDESRLTRHPKSGLQEYIAVSKYSRHREDLGRRELFEEAADRVGDMHRRRFAPLAGRRFALDAVSAEFGLTAAEKAILGRWATVGEAVNGAFTGVREKRWLPSMRSLQFGGEAIERNHSRLYNCSFSHVNRVRVFSEAMYLLLCGTGVGFSVQRHHVDQLPAFPVRGKEDDLTVEHYLIPDTIEGWADALEALITSYLRGVKIEFNYSAIRAKGSRLKTSGGKAPGHLPLKRTLTAIERVLDGVSGRKMKPIEAYDIMMFAARAVLSGGIRRSATIALFSADDMEMASAKTGNWFDTNPQRSGSNNSGVLVRGETTEAEFNELFEKQKEFGEPGFYFTESAEYGTNPCVAADTWVMTSIGARQVADLIATPFQALVDGQAHASRTGFVQTGVKQTLRVETDRGGALTLTPNHRVRVLTRQAPRAPWVEHWVPAGELKVGDRIARHDHAHASWGENGEVATARGYLLGCLLGDGNIMDGAKTGANLDFWGEDRLYMRDFVTGLLRTAVPVWNTGGKKLGQGDTPKYHRCRVSSAGLGRLALQYGMTAASKHNFRQIEQESSDFTAAFLQGWFDADGGVQGSVEKGLSVRLGSTEIDSLWAASRMLARLGVASRVYRNRTQAGVRMLPDGRGGQRAYQTQAMHELVVSGRRALERYEARVGFRQPAKVRALQAGFADWAGRSYEVAPGAVVRAVSDGGVQPVYDCTVEEVHAFDANGYYVSNCSEIGLAPFLTVTGPDVERLKGYGYLEPVAEGDTLYGYQFCNLSTINGGRCETPELFYEGCVAASMIGTIQASYTEMPYLGAITRVINERESLLGVSITGILDNPGVLLNPEVLERGALLCRAANALMAEAIGISRAARITCVKPEGTSSLLLDTGSGIHPHHAKRYFRRVQANRLEPVYQHFKAANPHMSEVSVYNPATDDVIIFPVEARDGAILRDDVDAMTFLGYVHLVQRHWVVPGTNVTQYNPGLAHNVSNTVTVKPHEWEAVRRFIWEHRVDFTGISLLQASGDTAYAQAPRQAVTTLEDIRKWNALQYREVDYTMLFEAEDNTALKDVVACAGGACEISF